MRQTLVPNEIIVIDLESDDATVSVVKKCDTVQLTEINRNDFDYGKTRDVALRKKG